MTIESTSPAGVSRATTNTFKQAFAVAERVVGELLSALPHDVRLVDDLRGGVSLDLYFHGRPDLVVAAAAQLGAQPQEAPHGGTRGGTYTSMDVVLDGISVHAWALTDTETPAVTA